MAEVPSTAPASSSRSEGDWNLLTIRRMLMARRWLILFVAAEVFLVSALVTFLTTPVYEASARVLIERATPKVMEGEDVAPVVWNEFEIQRFYQTQYLLLKDPAVLRQALDRHGVREALLETIAPKDERVDGQPLPNDEQLAGVIRERLRIDQLEYSDMVRVSFRHPSAEVAANTVNAVVEAYREFFVSSSVEARGVAKDFLTSEVERAQADVRELEAQLAAMRGKIQAVLPSSGSEMGKARLESLDQTLTEAKMRRAQAEAKLAAYEHSSAMALDEVRGDAQVIRYQEHLAAMKRDAAELEGKVGSEYPRLRELRSAIGETEKNLGREQQRLYQHNLQAARVAVDRARRDVAKLETLLHDELRTTAVQQAGAVDFEQLRGEYDQKRQALTTLLSRQQEVQLSANLRKILEQQVSIVDPARPPEGPAAPRVKLNLLVGLLFGLFLGVGAAVTAQALDNKVRTAQQLQELTRLPILGAIPRVVGREKPRLAFSRSASGKAQRSSSPVIAAQHHDAEEAFRALRSALLLAKAGAPPRTLLITSALPAEGKSTISANIGRTLAAFGQKVILIDADLRHPRLHRVFKVSPAIGLTNLLVGSATAEEALQETKYPGLRLLAGGPCPPDPATLLDPKQLKGLFEHLQVRHGADVILIDTPPTLVFADAFNVVSAVEGVILVGRARQTPKDAIRQAADALRRLGAPLLGAVLNGESSEDQSGSYYRYYHYRYGYYGKQNDAAPDPHAPTAKTAASGPVQVADQEESIAL